MSASGHRRYLLARDTARDELANLPRRRRRRVLHYGYTDTDGTQPDCWRYVVEVQDAGLSADDTGYR